MQSNPSNDFTNFSYRYFTICILISFISIHATHGEKYEFARRLNQKAPNFGLQKLSHVRFFWHDTPTGPNPSSFPIAIPPSSSSKTRFGTTYMFDDPLTEGPELSSNLVGRAQGFYASTSLEEVSLLITMNIVFTEGKYNGSTITVVGRNPVLYQVKELPVVGGTGFFRFARGFAVVSVYSFDEKSANATDEYNIYVIHF